MTLKQYLSFMLLGTILCWIAWGLIVTSTDPTAAPWFVFFFFYASLFLALIGTFSLLGFGWRIWQHKQESVIFRHVRKTFRQGVLFAALVISALYLKSQEMLTLWTSILLVFVLVVFESFFLSQTTPRKKIR